MPFAAGLALASDPVNVRLAANAHFAAGQRDTEASLSWAEAMAGFEKRFLSEALRANGGHVIETAAQIGMGRATLYKKIAAYGIAV